MTDLPLLLSHLLLLGVACAGVGFGLQRAWRPEPARPLQGAWRPEPARPLLPVQRLDPQWLVMQLEESVQRHSGKSFGFARCGNVVVIAVWAESSWAGFRWAVTIRAGDGSVAVSAPDDASMYATVLAELQRMAGAR